MKERKYAKFIWAGIVLAVLFMVWPFNKKNDSLPVDVKKEIRRADSIRVIIDKRKDTREQIDARILEIQNLKDSVNRLRVIIKDYELKIKQYNEKANNVSKLSANELVKFLTERYKDSVPTKRR